eukprot:981679_1
MLSTLILYGLITTLTNAILAPGQLESLVGKTTEENGIAWIKAFTCTHHQSYVYDAPFNDQTGFIEYAKYATSIKMITPNSNIEVYAQECNSQIISMNNGYDFSFTCDANTHKVTGYSNKNAWVGSNSYVANSCYPATGVGQFPRPLATSMFHACNNGPGFHMIPANNDCAVNGQTVIDVYLGFDDQLSVDCQNNPIPFGPAQTRDCSVLAIDEFLLQCSSAFPSTQQQVTDLDNRLTQNTNDITQLQNDLNNGNTVVTTEIQQLQTDIDNINGRFDLFAAKSIGNFNIDGNNGNKNNGFGLKDGIIILLLIGNLITMFYIYCWKKNKGVNNKKHVYVSPIDDDSDVEQLNPVKV